MKIMPFDIVRYIYSFLDGYYDKKTHCWIARIHVYLPKIARPLIVQKKIGGKETMRAVVIFEPDDYPFYAELRKIATEKNIEYSWFYYEKSKTNNYTYIYKGNKKMYLQYHHNEE